MGGALLAIAIGLSGTSGVDHDDSPALSAEESLEAVYAATPELAGEEVSRTSAQEPGEISGHSRTVTNTIDVDDGGRLTITPHEQSDDAISLRLVDHGRLQESTTTSEDDTAVFEHQDGYDYVPVLRGDGSIQAHTVIKSSESPTHYEYEVEVPSGGRLEVVGESILILDDQDSMVGGIAPAWAKDAAGNDVSTHYEVEGRIVTQVVDIDSSLSYPVVADPWAGINLFGHVYTDTYRSQPRVNASLSPWGWAVYTGAATGGSPGRGQLILNSDGLAEVLSRGADVRAAFNGKSSMYQQFACHALGALAAGQWNLERVRPTLNVSWTKDVLTHRCNWNYSNGRV